MSLLRTPSEPCRNGQAAPAVPAGAASALVEGCLFPAEVQLFLRQPPPTQVPSMKTRVLMTLGANDGQTLAGLTERLAPEVPDKVAVALGGPDPQRQMVQMALRELEGEKRIRRDGPTAEHPIWLIPPPPDPRYELHPLLSQELPRVRAEVDRELEWQLVTEGCQDWLWTWKHEGHTFLADGYRRDKFCRRHRLSFELRDVGLMSLDQVRAWLWITQAARRNCTELALRYARGRRYNEQKSGRGGDRRSDTARKQRRPMALAEELGTRFHVSESILKRDGAFAAALDKITEVCGPPFSAAVLSGTLRVGPSAVRQLAQLEEELMKPTVADWLAGKKQVRQRLSRPPGLLLPGETHKEYVASLLEQLELEEAEKFAHILVLMLRRMKTTACV